MVSLRLIPWLHSLSRDMWHDGFTPLFEPGALGPRNAHGFKSQAPSLHQHISGVVNAQQSRPVLPIQRVLDVACGSKPDIWKNHQVALCQQKHLWPRQELPRLHPDSSQFWDPGRVAKTPHQDLPLPFSVPPALPMATWNGPWRGRALGCPSATILRLVWYVSETNSQHPTTKTSSGVQAVNGGACSH